ncbi:right-handed parallel beta-helix repeat-containing protein, partial [Crocinitomicaceae bacterium]|nr:right-handed parallel beta-helix repeat-containing protein [Crocinitomicaceae bacterium]
MKLHKIYIPLLFIATLLSIAGLSACKKPVFYSSGNLDFSADTVVFDTIFTTIGSTTKQLKIYNNDNRTLTVSKIELAGGIDSPYRINVDGISGTLFSEFELEGGDSLFVFVEVTLDPNNGTLPLVVEDEITFTSNGTEQSVKLLASGQDAYFHFSDFSLPNGDGLDINSGTWPNDKPHVILNVAFIDSATTLTIPQGTDVYLQKGGILYNYKGTLNIEGTLSDPVTFQGDRLEPFYDDVSGQYYGIYMREALPSKINYAHIKNGTSGIHMYSEASSNPSYTLQMSNTIIENCASYGVFIYSGAKVQAQNCLIARNGVHSLLVLEGGDFNFNNCHLLSYGTGGNAASAVGISNYFISDGIQTIGSINEGTLTNSVIYGNSNYELSMDTVSFGTPLTFNISNNLIKSEAIFTDPFFSNNLWNLDPAFVNESEYNFTHT